MGGLGPVSGNINPYSFFTQPISGKLAVPVEASVSLYAQFEFVQGVPAPEGGYSLERLRIIDSLLSQINSHRQAGTAPLARSDVDLAKPDETIARLSAQVHQMQRDGGPFKAWGPAQGLVVDLSA